MIPDTQVAVVTGDPRSGTSALMRALAAAGVPIAGEQWPGETAIEQALQRTDDPARQERLRERLQTRRARHARMNQHGFWEAPGTVIRGLDDLGEHGGRAIKIVSRGLLEPPVGYTDHSLVWRYVLCLRHPRHIAESQRDLHSSKIDVQLAQEDDWKAHHRPMNPVPYLAGTGRLCRFLHDHPEIAERVLVADYDSLVSEPDYQLRWILKHLEHDAGVPQIEAAAATYDPTLRRKAVAEKWPDEWTTDGVVAEQVYRALSCLTDEALLVAADLVDERLEHHRLENVRWWDPSVAWMVTPLVVRRMEDPGYKRNLRGLSRRRIEAGAVPDVCEGFEDNCDDAPTYTVDRPADLGPLTRPMVRYCGRWATYEAVQAQHAAVLNDRHQQNPTPVPDRIRDFLAKWGPTWV